MSHGIIPKKIVPAQQYQDRRAHRRNIEIK